MTIRTAIVDLSALPLNSVAWRREMDALFALFGILCIALDGRSVFLVAAELGGAP